MTIFGFICLGLILLKLAVELWLERLNRQHVRRHQDRVPEPFRGTLDDATYQRSIQYTLSKSRFSQFESVANSIILVLVLFSGFLPWFHHVFTHALGTSLWATVLFLFSLGLLLIALNLPLNWHAQFELEQRYGFNTMTPGLWWMDQLKGVLVGAVIGLPLLWLVLKIIQWTGHDWWLWAWGCLLLVQLLMRVIAPLWILPLFNKFTPLETGSLRDRLLALAQHAKFPARSIQVMDGSKRSRHSNAFFTGFGRFRKIVLYDTLLTQLSEPELAAVLAHEIGHYKLRHLHKMFLGSAISTLFGFYLLSRLSDQAWFYQAFGLPPGNLALALLLFLLLAGLATFWISPVFNQWSRRFEYQADAFAREATGEYASLIAALRKLAANNLSNLTPHPLYSTVYYSHPTLLERERALARSSGTATTHCKP